MTSVHVVTLTCDFGGPASPAQLATALLADAQVITVRIGQPGSAAVLRLDIDADTHAVAISCASVVVEEVAQALGITVHVRSSQSVLESERGPVNDQA